MKLSDIIDDEIEIRKAKEASERIKALVREGLDQYEQAFGSKFVDIVLKRSKRTSIKCDSKEFRDYSLGKKCNKFLKKKLLNEKAVREEYYETYPNSRPKSGEDENQMPPLEMVPSLAFISGLKYLFEGLGELERKEISDMFGIKPEDMIKIFDHFHKVRNKCSHNQGQSRIPELLFCLRKFVGPSEVTITGKGEPISLNLNESLFGTMTLLGHMLGSLPYNYMSISAIEWKHQMIEQLSILSQKLLVTMGFPDEWMDHQVWRKSRRKSIQGIGVLHNSNFQALEDMYNELESDLKREIDFRTQLLMERFTNKGWDISGSGMDNCEWTARMCVMRSVLGSYNEVCGIPKHHLNLARVLANGSDDEDNLLNAYNDYHAGKLVYDSMCICIPKGATDDLIFKKVERWMLFDKERRDSDYHKSLRILSDVVRNGGPMITLTGIEPTFVYPFIHELADSKIHNFKGDREAFTEFLRTHQKNHVNEFPEWIGPKTSLDVTHKLYDVCRHTLMNKIGESGVVDVKYYDTHLWPKEITINLNDASPEFKEEIEDQYKLRDPEKVGCKPYDAPFSYPVILESKVNERLKESAPKENPFGSLDASLRYSYGYYFRCVEMKIREKIKFNPDLDPVSMQTACRRLIAKNKGKYWAKCHAKIMLGGVCIAQKESTIPIEVEGKKGALHLNTIKMKRTCSREIDGLVGKAVKKIRRRS